MSRYIATFHSHFGAISYVSMLKKQGIIARPMPVPRQVSASCGTCVLYENVGPAILPGCELDCIYISAKSGYEKVYSQE